MTTILNSILLHIHEHEAVEGSFGHNMPAILGDVLADSLEITGWVILMMTLIEIINVSSSGKWMQRFQNKPFLQILLAALLGAIPGCAGGFAVVSMFTHNVVPFGAFIAGMVATFGDESFYLFAQSPRWATILTAVLFGIAIVVGLFFDLIGKKWNFTLEPHEFAIHDDIDHHGHHHHEHNASETTHGFWNKVAHFFKEHFWEHVVKQHLLKVFLWSFCVILLLKCVGHFVDIKDLMQEHAWAKFAMLILAVLVGFIPESGPNLIFIVMFLNGSLPFSILLANSISQNGHAGLPLLAQSRKNFFLMKGVTMALGLLCGAILLAVGL
ncbi:MAG: arsenic efflux protein [Bacteroidales bacterium]|nr:arsenic efflux protein [Bacteroidales bacterium]